MKKKLHMPLVMFTIIGLALAGWGCSDNEEPFVDPPSDAEYVITTSDLFPTKVKINVFPKDKTKLYFAYVLPSDYYESELDGNPENLKEFVPALIEKLATDAQMSVADALNPTSGLGRIGDKTIGFGNIKPQTSNVAFAIGVDIDGNTTDDGNVITFTTPKEEEDEPVNDGPDVTIEMAPGDLNGQNKTTFMTVTTRSTGVVSGKEALFPSADVAIAIAQGKTYTQILDENGFELDAEYIDGINTSEGIAYAWKGCSPSTEYIYIIKVQDKNNGTTIAYKKQITDPSATGGTTVDVALGDENGQNTFATATVTLRSSNVVRGLELFNSVEFINGLLGSGLTYDKILDMFGNELLPAALSTINTPQGYVNTWLGFKPSRKYIYFVKLFDGSNWNLYLREVTTDASPNASEAYKAWLGNWTVKSESSEISKSPISFDISIREKITNYSYSIIGWSISLWRTSDGVPMEAKFKNNGEIEIENLQYHGNIPSGEALMNMMRYYDPINKEYKTDMTETIALKGKIGFIPDKAIVEGTQFKNKLGTYTATGIDYFGWNSEKQEIIGYDVAAGFTKNNYPVGPFTLTKKSSASASMDTAPTIMMPQSFAMSNTVRSNAANKNLRKSMVINGPNMPLVMSAMHKTKSVCNINSANQQESSKKSNMPIIAR